MAKRNYAFTNEYRSGFGNLTRNPKKISGSNAKTTVVVVDVAVNSQNVDRDGDVIERVDYYNIKLFGRDAELAYVNLSKGDRIRFGGSVYPTEYINKDDEIVESVEIRAGFGDVYPAPLWDSFDTSSVDDDEDDEKLSRRERRSSSAKKKSSAKRSRKYDEDEAEDWDDDEELDDDFEEDAEPKRPSRSRSRSRSKARSKSTVDIDDDADDYEEQIL